MTLIDHIPSPAEIAARRARMGMPYSDRPVSAWHKALADKENEKQRAAFAELQRERERINALAPLQYRCVVDTTKTAETVKQARKPAAVRMRRAIRLIAVLHKVPIETIMGDGRQRRVVRARWAAFYMATKLTGWSIIDIGRKVGGKDHTTVLHALKKLGKMNPRRAYLAKVPAP